MEKTFHYLMLMTQTIFQKGVLAEAARIGLSPGQPKILEYLATYDGSEQRSIGEACSIEPATVTGILGRMEMAGLIERRKLKGNRRSLHVFLTDRGRKVSADIDGIFKKMESIAFASMSESRQAAFLEALSEIHMNLSADGGNKSRVVRANRGKQVVACPEEN